jgi:RHS repeat-associated protein
MVESLSRPNGSVTGYQYDPVLKTVLTQVDNATSADSLISRFDYTYNAQDLIESETITGLISLPQFQEGLTEYDYNEVNQLLSATEGSQAFTYDSDGNMLTGFTPEGRPLTATYDAASRLSSVEYRDGQDILHKNEYAYNWTSFVAGIKQYEGGNLVTDMRILRAGGLDIQERNSANAVTAEYVWGKNLGGGIGGLLQLRRGTSDYVYQYDGRGNVSSLLDSGENIAASYRYDAFGNLLAMGGSFDQPFQFNTKRCDQGSGLNYYGYRFYAPAIGRWMNRDPLGEEGGINLYGFVQNDPVNWVDPWGLFWIGFGEGFSRHIAEEAWSKGNTPSILSTLTAGLVEGAKEEFDDEWKPKGPWQPWPGAFLLEPLLEPPPDQSEPCKHREAYEGG